MLLCMRICMRGSPHLPSKNNFPLDPPPLRINSWIRTCYDCLYQIDVFDWWPSDFTTCVFPPVCSTLIIILHVLKSKHWLYIHALCQKMFFWIVFSPVFFSYVGVGKGWNFYSLVFFFNDLGNWSIGIKCNI